MLSRIDHVGFAVRSLAQAIDLYRDVWKLPLEHRETLEEHGVEEAMFRVGDSYVQLLGSLSPTTPVGRFLERRGEGLHHIAYEVADIEAALADLAASGVEIIDAKPRTGSRNTRVAFVNPNSTLGVLVELVEHPRPGSFPGARDLST